MTNNQDAQLENARSQMRKGTLEFCILLIISRGEVYASDILERLREADVLVVEGTLYPILSRLKTAQLVEYSWEESKLGPPRKYYKLTSEGKRMLTQLKKTWGALSESINSLLA